MIYYRKCNALNQINDTIAAEISQEPRSRSIFFSPIQLTLDYYARLEYNDALITI